MNLTHGRASGDGVTLHYVEAGNGPAVVLLHGFPDFWYGWRHQLAALADAGFRVIAPDLRGYNESDRPRPVCAYAMRHLVADVAALLTALAPDGATLVGHDWGGMVAWQLAARRPDLLRSLVILNAPHPDAYLRVLRTNPVQALRSWYVLVNQLPRLPEAALQAGRAALLRRVLRRAEDGSRMSSEAELDRYAEVFSGRGCLTGPLNYYRAAFRGTLPGRRRERTGSVDVPVFVVWGERDPFVDRSLPVASADYAPHLTVQYLPHVGHFLHWQDPRTVNALLLAHLRSA